MPDETDAKVQDHPNRELEETTGTHSYYVDEEDYLAGPEIQYLFLSHVHSGE